MRQFTDSEIEKYLKYIDENKIDINDEDVKGRCLSCGKHLNDVELPDGPERKVTCLSCLEWFIEDYEELENDGSLS
ncbi:hypothetical protein [Staphylococcus succinus]|uniref:Uncharacterized protein n=1 Tax=Staphylococcus succinus TaxID=61015 RepID=A0A9Q6HRB5_9STAP|nr:hypothetical protein [Staphylococcus succinus]PTI77509.1 hypothetical protein BU058_00790 [Staphylococcus succinus]